MDARVSTARDGKLEPGWLALVRREFVTSARQPRTFGIMAILLCLAVVLLIYVWPSGQYRERIAQIFAERLLFGTGAGMLGAILILMPAFMAGTVTLERERGTYDILHTSLIGPSGIVLGKMINGLAFLLLAFVATLPLLATSMFLTGIEPVVLVQLTVLVLTTGIICAAVSLCISVYNHTTLRALAFSYAACLGIYLLVPVLMAFVVFIMLSMFILIGVQSGIVMGLRYGTPFGLLFGLLSGDTSWLQFTAAIGGYWLAIAGLLWFSVRGLRRPINPPKVTQKKPIDTTELLRARMRQFPFYIIDPLRRKPPIPDTTNPMTYRETRYGLLNRGTTLVRLIYASAIVFFLAGGVALVMDSARGSFLTWYGVQLAALMLFAPAMTAGVFTKEREMGNLDMLRMTLLRPAEMVRGKFVAGILSVSPVFMGAVCAAAMLQLFFGFTDVRIPLVVLGDLAISSVLCLSIGLFSSLLVNRTVYAVVVAYSLTLAVFAVSLGGGAIEAMGRQDVDWLGWLMHLGGFGTLSAIFFSCTYALFHFRHMQDR